MRALGYTTWHDVELPPHRPYAEVIQERLEQAKAVVVLWSQESVRSQWVRSEANHAREKNKLVQVSVDGTMPPIPFDQIHCAQFRGWRGNLNTPDWERVARSVGDLVGRTQEKVGDRPSSSSAGSYSFASGPPASIWRRPATQISVAVAALVILGAAGSAWLMRDSLFKKANAPSSELKVAVLPFETLSPGQNVRYFADSLQDEITSVLSGYEIEPVSHDASAELRGPNARQAITQRNIRLILDGTVRNDGDTTHVRVHLDDPEAQVTLWSREYEAEIKDASLLQTRVAYGMVAVLTCARQVLQPNGGLSDQSLVGRYLHACDVFANWDVHQQYDPKGYAEWLETQRTLTVKAPNFAPAQYAYATFAGITAKSSVGETATAMLREAETHLRLGLSLDPKDPNAFAVRSLLVANTDWGERERLLRSAVAAAPSWPQGNLWLSALLAETGRMREAVTFAQRAAAGDMVYDWGLFYSGMVCLGDGPWDQAIQDIEHDRKLVPESLFAQDIHVFCLSGAGRWEEARKTLLSLPQPALETPFRGPALQTALVAADSRKPEDLKRAREELLAEVKRAPMTFPAAIGWLSTLGFVDDAVALMHYWDPNPAGLQPNIWMFGPLTKNLRRDPRFMEVAARIKLVDYWRTSGHWPDYCAEPGLPYDCKTEAAKVLAAAATTRKN